MRRAVLMLCLSALLCRVPGLRAAEGQPAFVPLANAAFVSGFRLVLLIGCLTLVAGALAAAVLVRTPRP